MEILKNYLKTEFYFYFNKRKLNLKIIKFQEVKVLKTKFF